MKISALKPHTNASAYALRPDTSGKAKKSIQELSDATVNPRVLDIWKRQSREAVKFTSHAEKWISKSNFTKEVKKHGQKAVLQAIKTCQKIWKLKQTPGLNLGLKAHQLFKIAFFIETKLPTYIEKGKHYLNTKTTGLKSTIEYDPKSKRTFIHLNGSLGSGVHKKVSTAVLYSHKKPVFVAHARSSENCAKEVKMHKKFRNKQGLAHTYAVTQHVNKKKKKITSLFLKLYSGLSLRHHQHNPGKLSKKEKVIVARDLLYGLENMHKKNLIHCDMHGGNALLHREKKEQLSAVLIDFGRTKSIHEARWKAPRIEAASRTNPPENFTNHKSHVRPKAVDIYALGCQLYFLAYKTLLEVPSKKAFVHAYHGTHSTRHAFRKSLSTKIKKIQTLRKKQLEENKTHHKTTPYDRFKKVVLQMCHFRPKVRSTAHKLRVKLDHILKQM